MIGNPPKVDSKVESRVVSAVRTVFIRPRGVASVGTNGNESTLELDSHADTCCLGGEP